MRLLRTTVIAAVISVPLTLLVSCQSSNPCFAGNPVVRPATDGTPPTALVEAHIPNQAVIVATSASGPQTAHIPASGVIVILARGDDPEGVNDARVWLTEVWTFTDPQTGNTTMQGPGLVTAPVKSNPVSTAVGGTACTGRVASWNLDVGQHRKGATTYTATVWGEAINFGKVSTKGPKLTLTSP